MIQMRQQFARIGMDTTPGKWDMRQPPADIEMKFTPAKLETRYIPGELSIDQSRAREALGQGSPFQFTARVATESKQLALEGIGRRVEDGHKLGDIAHNKNAISDMAWQEQFRDYSFPYDGPYSYDSVDIQYTAHQPESNYTPSDLEVNVTPHKPEIQYTPGSVSTYMIQKQSLEIIPPQIDMKI
jgi:hypothetical protein